MPAWWAVAVPAAPGGTVGNTDATITGGLTVNPEYTPDVDGKVTVWADTAEDAVGEALRGVVSATIGGDTVDYYFTPDHTGTGSDGLPFALSMAAGVATVALEDQAYFPDLQSDNDYNDFYCSVHVQATGDPVVDTGSWTWVSPQGETANVLMKVTRTDPDTYHWQYRIDNVNLSKINKGTFGLGSFGLFGDDVDASTVENVQSTKPGWYYGLAPLVWDTLDDHSADVVPRGDWAVFAFDTDPRPVVVASGRTDTNGESWFRSTAASGEAKAPGEKPVVMITDGNNQDIGAGGLKVAKWENAFEPALNPNGKMIWYSADGQVVAGYNAQNQLQGNPILGHAELEVRGLDASKLDFIDRDPDRFNVWVRDLPKWQDQANMPAADQRNTVKISTKNVKGFEQYDDAPTEVDMVRVAEGFAGKGAGWFWSDSQLLVSNQVDDTGAIAGIQTDEQKPGGPLGAMKNGSQWLPSDRTHKVALRGEVKADYPLAVPSIKPVPVRHTVKVHAIVLNGQDNATPVVNQHEVNADVNRANEQFAQVGILFVPYDMNKKVTWPAGVDLSNGLSLSAPEELALYGANNPALRTPQKDDIELYYVNYFNNLPALVGYSIDKAGNPQSAYDTVVIAADKRASAPFTLAHEIGHILLDVGDAGHVLSNATDVSGSNLMRGKGTSLADALEASKRLTGAQDAAINSKRPDLFS